MDEALGVSREGRSEDRSTRELGLHELMVDVVRGQQRETRVVMLEVVSVEEVLAECTRIFDRPESRREISPILECFELRLGVGVVVRDMRPRVRLRDAEVRERECEALRLHRRATIGVHRELAGLDAFTFARLEKELPRERRRLTRGDHPT